LSEHEWDPQNLQLPRASQTVEEEISRTLGALWAQGGNFFKDLDNDVMDCMFDIKNKAKRIIASIKVVYPPRKASQVETEVQDVPQVKTFQTKGCHSLLSPEDLGK
jgi:hypothetical protein